MESEREMKAYKNGYVAGVFDLFHVGHLNLLENAKGQCSHLIVGILTDELVIHFKHKPPYIPFEERIRIVRSLRVVDEAVEVDFSSIDKMDAWRLYHFDCLFSGDDYVDNPSWIADQKRLQSVGSDIYFFPYTKSTSSTSIKTLIVKSLL